MPRTIPFLTGLLVVFAQSGTAHAQPAQDRPSQPESASITLQQWLDGEFSAVVQNCTGLTQLRRRSGNAPVSAIPGPVRENLANRLTATVESYPDRKLTTLFATVWSANNGANGQPATYSPQPRFLGLNFAIEEDRIPFAGMSNIQHTHTCSSVLGFAIRANGELKLSAAEIKSALESTFENTSTLSVSMSSGRFFSPVPVVLGIAPEVQRPTIDAFATYMAVWDWYAVSPVRAGQRNYIIERIDGVARYRYSGLTMDTMTTASAGASSGLLGFSASLEGSGRVSANGATDINNFQIVRFSGPDTMQWAELPTVETVAARAANTAHFVPLPEEASRGPIVNTQPYRLAHRISGIPTGLCNEARWTATNVSNFRMSTRDDAEGQNGQVCVLTSDYTPPTTPEDDGSLSVQYSITTTFPASSPSVAGRDLVLRVPATPVEVADARSRLAFDFFSGTLLGAPATDTSVRVSGNLRYRIVERLPTTATGIGAAPRVTVACAGDAPVRIPTSARFVPGQTSLGQPPEVHIDLQETTLTLPADAPGSGECVVDGVIDVIIANANQTTARTLPSRTFPSVTFRAAPPLPPRQAAVP